MIRAINKWFTRHQNPVNFWLHMLGIPLTILALPLAVIDYWLVALAVFVSGYALQFIGHAVEGNHSGEALLVRRWLKLDLPDSFDRPLRRRQRPR